MEIERGRRHSSSVNLTPLIDVVFLLIVFFMLSTSFVDDPVANLSPVYAMTTVIQVRKDR